MKKYKWGWGREGESWRVGWVKGASLEGGRGGVAWRCGWWRWSWSWWWEERRGREVRWWEVVVVGGGGVGGGWRVVWWLGGGEWRAKSKVIASEPHFLFQNSYRPLISSGTI